jgi:hypothetical protein
MERLRNTACNMYVLAVNTENQSPNLCWIDLVERSDVSELEFEIFFMRLHCSEIPIIGSERF